MWFLSYRIFVYTASIAVIWTTNACASSLQQFRKHVTISVLVNMISNASEKNVSFNATFQLTRYNLVLDAMEGRQNNGRGALFFHPKWQQLCFIINVNVWWCVAQAFMHLFTRIHETYIRALQRTLYPSINLWISTCLFVSIYPSVFLIYIYIYI